MVSRAVKKIVTGTRTTDGAGVRLVRVIGHDDVADFDPFLMLDAFDSTNPADYVKGFPWHPHRGIETVTYLISGSIEHGDSLGNKGVINDGCCQWMTAGSGIIHQEMPQASPRMLGLQLWINLPKKYKMTAPQYIRFILFAGKPLGEPVAWGGPIVINTMEELKLAFDELKKGTFLKHQQ